MRYFVITGHRAVSTGDFKLDDIAGGAGRLDILVRCVNSAFFLSHNLRKDVEAYLVLMVLPFQITMVPNYLVLDALGLMDTPWAVILPGIFSTFPVFIMKKGFDAVPDSLLEAAALDGAGPLGTFVRIGLPLGLPGICSALVLSFIEAWNAIEQPMLFLRDQSNWPLSLYLSNITVEDLGLAMVASLLMLAPPLLLFLVGQNYLEQGIGLSAGASEGM